MTDSVVQIKIEETNVVQTVDTERIVIREIGGQGPRGPAGTGSGGTSSYEHFQLIASNQWIINHNLGYKPLVQVFNSGSSHIDVEAIHTSDNQVIIYLNTPITGFARLV